MKNHLELKRFRANQAGLPGKVASIALAFLSLNSSEKLQLFLTEDSTNLIGNLGFLILKIFSHSRSNKAATKNPTARADIVNKSRSLSKVINGNNIQQLQNLIKRTFGKYLAYASNCAAVIDQSSGILVGNLCQNWSLIRCNLTSSIVPTIGYIKIKKAPAARGFLVNNIIIVIIRLVISSFATIASNPEHAITLGSLKKFLSFILVKTLIRTDLLKVTQNHLKAY